MLDLDYTMRVRLPIVVLTVIVTYGATFWIGTPTRDMAGYQPDQPIAFSHKLHAGEMQLDCRYCHVGVNQSRHANIPSVDTCMNCHNVVQTVGRDEADGFVYNGHEILPKDKTLAASVGSVLTSLGKASEVPSAIASDLNADAMRSVGSGKELAAALNGVIEDDAKRKAFIEKYAEAKDWTDPEIAQLMANADDAQKGQKLTRFMMDEMFFVDSYKSAEIKKLREHFNTNTPIPWKRIYRLPEYVYFNHSVHVNKGIDCERCHGDIEKMDKIKQVRKYNMGRCLDCHRGDYHSGLTEEVYGPENCSACHR